MEKSLLATNLLREMERHGFNDYSLAIASGLKADAVRDIMRGRSQKPSADKLDAMARVLGTTPAELLGTQPQSQQSQAPGPHNPGELVNKPTEKALLAFWRGLPVDEQVGMLTEFARRFAGTR